MIQLDISDIQLQLRDSDGKTQVFDPVRKRWLILTPEEHVRQYIIQVLTRKLNYPAALLSVEKQIEVNGMVKRFDVVVYNREHKPWMLVECKAPEVMIAEATLHQLLNYQRNIQCRYWLLTNGHQTFCADAQNVAEIKWLSELPAYDL
jgi:hypothetical protein